MDTPLLNEQGEAPAPAPALNGSADADVCAPLATPNSKPPVAGSPASPWTAVAGPGASSNAPTPLTEPLSCAPVVLDVDTTSDRLSEPTGSGQESEALPPASIAFRPAHRRAALPRRRIAWLVVVALLGLLAAGVWVLCIMCFVSSRGAADAPACALYMAPLQRLSERTRGDTWRASSKLLRLLNSLALVVSTVLLLHATSELQHWVLFYRRARRYEARTHTDESRAASAAKLNESFRKVMELMHDPSLKVSLSFEQLSYSLRDGTPVLQDATGEVSADEITVLMGPSGCGKSTLLGLLSGKLTPTRGSLKLNGRKGSVREVHKLIGFVPQDDIMLSTLTVMELLTFSAKLRLPADTPRRQLEVWVYTIIDLLGLGPHRHTVVGDAARRGLSGGQRKRVNIGIELVADPSLIFLDEPTSGLDSTVSLELMQCLRRLSTAGVAVCAVLHQPRLQVFELAHKLLLLDGSGRTAYMGAVPAAVPYFESLGIRFEPRENIADQLLDVVSGALQPTAAAASGDFVSLAESWQVAAQQRGSPWVRRLEASHTVDASDRWSESDGGILAAQGGVAAQPGNIQAAATDGGRRTRGSSSEGAPRASGDVSLLPPPATHVRQPSGGAGPAMLRQLQLRGNAALNRLERRLQRNGGRSTAGFCRQLRVFVVRSSLQLRRAGFSALRDLLLACVVGLLLGFLYEGTFEQARCGSVADQIHDDRQRDAWIGDCADMVWFNRTWFERAPFYCSGQGWEGGQFDAVRLGYSQALTLSLLALAIISIQVNLNMFGAERTVFWRESRHHSVLAYALGKNLAQLPLTLAYPFFLLLFFYQLLRPYAPFQSFYVALLLVQWAGEGIGQLVSLQLNASRQLAGGVAALLFTVLSGSFPLLPLSGPLVIFSYISFVRWGMEGLLSVEDAPWALGDPTSGGHRGGCCDVRAWQDGACGSSLHAVDRWPSSAGKVHGLLNSYGYTLLPGFGHVGAVDLSTAGGARPGVSGQACFMLLAIGVVVRLLTYLSLLLKDRTRRR